MSVTGIIAVVAAFAIAPAIITWLTRTAMTVLHRNGRLSTWGLAINLLLSFGYAASAFGYVMVAALQALPLWPCTIGVLIAAVYQILTLGVLRGRGRPAADLAVAARSHPIERRPR